MIVDIFCLIFFFIGVRMVWINTKRTMILITWNLMPNSRPNELKRPGIDSCLLRRVLAIEEKKSFLDIFQKFRWALNQRKVNKIYTKKTGSF